MIHKTELEWENKSAVNSMGELLYNTQLSDHTFDWSTSGICTPWRAIVHLKGMHVQQK